MNSKLNSKLLGIPVIVWVAQLLYVILALVLLLSVQVRFDSYAVPKSSFPLYSIIYVLVMIIANIVWRLAISRKHSVITIGIIAASVVINLAIAQFFVVQNAHTSFENYYKFRGCSTLVSRSPDNAVCKLPSGESIKIVLYQNKWYLDGDLPSGLFSL